jgi:eukaryotic-like serine/threonine-protein kinase
MKVLARDLSTSPEYRRNFVDEARISGQLEHPNILPVHELGVTAEGDAYFTMKLLEGAETLRDVIERLAAKDPETHARFTFDRRVALIQQVCNALAHAHARGVVHRDIKPSNILLGRTGEVYLVDWGIAATRPQTADGATLVGTPQYMAPEQAQGLAADARSDVYSLTAVLYELLSLTHYLGRAQPGGSGQWGLLRRVIEEAPADAESHVDPVAGRVPRMLSRLCRRGLNKDPRRRFQSARELEESLQSWQEGCGPLVCPGTALQRGMTGGVRWIDRHPRLAPALIIAVLVALLGGNLLGAAHALGWI